MGRELEPPKEEGIEIIFDAGYGRCMVSRRFKPPKSTSYTYRIWWYLKKFPSIVFPLTTDRHVVALREFRHGMADFSLELPGGLPDVAHAESEEDTARRELLEETGYEAGELIRLACDPWINTQSINLRYYPFLGINCKCVAEPIPEETVLSEVVLVSLEEWYNMIFRGEVVENSSIAHSLLALPYLLKEGLRFK